MALIRVSGQKKWYEGKDYMRARRTTTTVERTKAEAGAAKLMPSGISFKDISHCSLLVDIIVEFIP